MAERTIRIKFDGTSKGLASATAKARAELKALEKQVEANKNNTKAFADGVLRGASGLAAMASKVATLATVLNVLPALTAGVIALSGGIGLAVGAGFALAGVMAAIKLGSDGAKRAFEKLNPTIDAMKAKISGSFERALTPAVNNFKQVLPQLTNGLQQIATAAGGVVTKFSIMAKQPATIGQLKGILGGTSQVVQNLGKFLVPVIQAFIRIGAVAMPLLVKLTSGLGAVGERFNAWIQRMGDTGNLEQWMQTAIDAFGQIFHVIGQLGDIVMTVISTLADAGLGLGGVFGPIIDQVQAFVNSAEGHDTIVALAKAINAIGTAVGQVLGAALRAVAPLMPDLLKAFQQLVQAFTPVLVSIVTGLGKALGVLATFLAENMTWLAPIVVTVVAFAAAIKTVVAIITVLQAIMKAWAIIQAVINVLLTANPIGVVVLAIAALIGIIILVIQNLDFFKGIWDAVWKWCSDLITTVVEWIKGVWSAYWAGLKSDLDAIKGIWNAVWKWCSDRISDVVNWIKDRWDWAVRVFQTAVQMIKDAWASVGDFISGVFHGIVGGIKSAINTVLRVINGAISGVNAVTGAVGIPGIPSIPYLAKGGTARGGKPYVVGERGPELFVPGQTGRVQSNSSSFGSGAAKVIQLTLDLGSGIKQVVEIEIDKSNNAIARTVGARPRKGF